MRKLCSAKLSKNNTKLITVNLLYVYSESDVDVTGVTEVNVNDSCYLLANDSVILKGDNEKSFREFLEEQLKFKEDKRLKCVLLS